MIRSRALALATGLVAISAAPGFAGHLFTQGDTNTPVWLQQGQAVYVEQYYSEEYDYTPGDFSVNFDDGDTSYFTDPANIPVGADTSDADWYKWNAGDVVQVTIQTAAGSMSWTAAFDQASGTCAYTFCGFDNGWGSGYDSLPQEQIPTYTSWGTFLPSLDTAIVTSGGGLDLTEINSLGTAGMESLAPYFFGASGSDDPAVAFAFADADSNGVISETELGTYVWEESYAVFDALRTANNGTASGALNRFGILFTALQGDFALTGYRIADAMGLNLHGSGSGPVDQSSVCSPPNCGPDAPPPAPPPVEPPVPPVPPAPPAVTPGATAASVYRSTLVVDQAMRQATQILVGAADQEVDVNFTETAGPTLSSSGLSMSSSGASMRYRWAARAEGSFDRNADLGNTRNGSFVVAYGLRNDLDIGVYGNRRGMDLSFGGYSFDGNMTSIGMYLRKRPDDGLGLQWKASLGGAVGSADISRAAGISGAEAGTGKADLDGRFAALELGYGSKMGETLLTSYGRLTYSKMGRDGYTEAATITAPVTYSAYNQTLTTLTLGLDADRRLSERVRLTGGLYAVRDLSRTADAVSGSAALGGLNDFTFAAPGVVNTTRVGADVTFLFDVGHDSTIYTRAGAQRAANTDKPTYSLAIGFETRF